MEEEYPGGLPLVSTERSLASCDGISAQGDAAEVANPAPLGLSKAHIWPEAFEVSASPLGRFLQLRTLHPGQQIGGGPRGDVTTFSRQSRKRMMQMFAKIPETLATEDTVFITLTYAETWPTNPIAWHGDLLAFCKRLERKHQDTATIWRMEMQKRGVPHFHLMTVGAKWVDIADVTRWWAEVAHVNSQYAGKYATKVERPLSWEQACAYLAKYMAKPSGVELSCSSGRWWGVRGRKYLPQSVLEAALSPSDFRRLKESLASVLPPEAINPYVLKLPIGLWSMLPSKLVAKLLETACEDTGFPTQYLALIEE